MEKRHISAHEVLQDIHAGLDDVDLMAKYKLSAKDFKSVCAKLIERGLISEVEFSELELLWAQKEGRVWHCPACHMPQSHQFDECPQCGIIVAKYELQHPKETPPPQEDEFVEVPPENPGTDVQASTGGPAPNELISALRCPACSSVLAEGAHFCTSCGTRVKD